jgi:hypothetical protein
VPESLRDELRNLDPNHSDVRVTQAAYAQLEDSTVRDEFMRIVA